ncbi:SCO6745 family protein [Streptomyces sp. URMC 129]|uniref:SCO6745 family protein n=1 Tax=Streptomyces sp. URMC 129 TaxID=3423407 RepID=UPI003F1DE3F2
MAGTDTLARRLWKATEPLHAVVYFAPEPAEAARSAGLIGWWMGYFAGRVAPAGPLDAGAAQALFFAFPPRRVGRALPDAWSYASPEKVLRTRMGAAQAALERALPLVEREELERLTVLLERAVRGCGHEGRALAAAWSAVPRPAALVGRLWLAATVLREHRGDGHVVALVHAGLTGVEAGMTHVATGAVSRDVIQTSRGWTDEEWDRARERLMTRGLLTADGRLTDRGHALRLTIEEDTDRLAADPVTHLGREDTEEAIRLATPLSRHLIDSGVIPMPNPIGVPRP